MSDITVESSCADIAIEKDKITPELIENLKTHGVVARVDKVDGKDEIVIYSTSRSSLSDYIPILQNFGFKIDSEFSYVLEKDSLEIFGRKYFLILNKGVEISDVKDSIKSVLESVLRGETVNSRLSSLSLLANLSPDDIRVLDAIITYEDQLLAEQSLISIRKAIIAYPKIAQLFTNYFYTKFDPNQKQREKTLEKLAKNISEEIKTVDGITEDKILNVFFDILKAMTRTNFFLHDEDLFTKYALALKINVKELLVHLKGIQPTIETFVYHNNFVGTHLRRTKVSRGGLRWSDRELDYRNEIKALMQAQRSKNSVIIPEGAKGGFYIKDKNVSKERFVEVYSRFINALLDVVDNLEGKEAVTNEKIVNYDGDDPYFVVAADKGTSAMSDVANAISIKRDFWLGDAFASGGSKGFNHKDMGITAKGSVKSTERFFLELDKDIQQKDITVIGIGSPAGDVFGNGIQLSKKFKLIAAISSRDIFIDPEPNMAKAFKERQRLFDNALGWEHYDTKLISKGGGVFKKADKTIKLNDEIKKLLNIKKDVVNGVELSRAVITAKADLLFNGGVGTYVRGEDESDSQIGDKPNESIRVNASQIQAYAVCEGGNLGFTQKARVDYAKRGGKISADSIDNSAGVHTSDYEVNLKIILNSLIKKSVISEENRLEVLHNLEPEIERIVLWTNYFQSLALSMDELRSKMELEQFKDTINVLEDNIDSFVAKEYEIPTLSEFDKALTKQHTILRPHLSVLLSFSKIFLKSRIMRDTAFLESELAQDFLYKYFPKSFDIVYSNEVGNHPLKNDIIATSIANAIINAQGSTFIHDFKKLGFERFMLKVKSFIVLDNIISANDIRHELFRQDYTMSAKKQYDLLLELEDTVNFLTSWVVEHGEDAILIFERAHEYKVSTEKFLESANTKVKEVCKNQMINKFFSMIDYIRMLTTIIKVKEDVKHDFVEIANLFATTTAELGILELNQYIMELEANNEWEERLKNRMLKKTIEVTSQIIDKVMHFKRDNETIEDAFKNFANIYKERYDIYLYDYKTMKQSGNINFINLNVVIGTLARIKD